MIYCPQCGTPNFDDANYCNTCGEPLVSAELYDQIRNKAEMEAYLEQQQREREAQAYSKAYRKAQKEAKREAARQAREQQGAKADEQAAAQANAQAGVQADAKTAAQSNMPTDPSSSAYSTQNPPDPQQEVDFPIYKHGCLAQAWDDITESPGWGKEVCLLGLVNMVPVLNFFVTGYSMKWASQLTRDEVGPMPDRIFADGSFLQGFYAFVVSLVVGLVSGAVSSALGFLPIIGAVIGICAFLLLRMFWALSAMRIAISNSLGPGFDIPEIFKAIFSNRFGKAFSVTIVPMLIVGAAIAFICGSLFIIFGLGPIGVVMNTYEMAVYGWYPWQSFLQALMSLVPLAFVMYLITTFLSAIATVLTLRATAHYVVRYERAWTMLGR